MFLLAEQVDWFLDNGGLEWAASRCDRSAEIVYGWAERTECARPFVTEPDERSHVTATIDLDESVDALAVAATLRSNGVLDTEPYRKLGRNQLRVALFPDDRTRRRRGAHRLCRLGRRAARLLEPARAFARDLGARHGRRGAVGATASTSPPCGAVVAVRHAQAPGEAHGVDEHAEHRFW